MKEKLTCEFKFNLSNSPKLLAQMVALVRVLIYVLFIIVIVEWKVQSDEYDKELEELRKKEAGINATLAQLQRQVKSKVIYFFFIIRAHDRRSELGLSIANHLLLKTTC